MRAILMGPVEVSDRVQKKLLAPLEIRSGKLHSNDLLIGVDGGAETWKRLGFRADLAIGDWDSIKKKDKILSQIPHVTLPRNKSRSDLFYAGVAAIESGANELVCLGVTGARPDHHLSMLYDLSNFSAGHYGKLLSVQAIGPEADYYFLSEAIPEMKISFPAKSTVSIFAMNGEAQGVSLKGFEFNLKDVVLKPNSHGLSNQTKKRICDVSLRKGQLLIILLRGGAK